MWAMSDCINLMILAVVSVIDIRKRRIPRWVCFAGIVSAVGYQMVVQNMSIGSIIGGAFVGICFLGISRLTEEGIGYGDSLGILALGIFLGFWQLVEVLCGAFFILLFAAMVQFMRKNRSGKSGLPFYPFLFEGYLIMLIGRV
ncbi:MAG: prepilin peptidase [Dorea sp.]